MAGDDAEDWPWPAVEAAVKEEEVGPAAGSVDEAAGLSSPDDAVMMRGCPCVEKEMRVDGFGQRGWAR